MFAPVRPLERLTISKHLGAGIKLGGLITVRPAAELPGAPPVVIGDRVFFANVLRDTDFSVEPTPTGVETFWQLRSIDSPQSFALDFTLARGMSMHSSRRLPGAIEIDRGARPYFVIPPPSIRDASGFPVHSSFTLRGTRLLLTVLHRGQDVEYPLEIDPLIEGIRGWYGTLSKYGYPPSSWPASGAWQAESATPTKFAFLSPTTHGFAGLGVLADAASSGNSAGWTIGSGPTSPATNTSYTGYIWRIDLTGVYSTGAPYTSLYAAFAPATTNGTPVYTNNAYNGAQGNMTDAFGDDWYVTSAPLSNASVAFCAASGGGADGQRAPVCDDTKGTLNNEFTFGMIANTTYSKEWTDAYIQGAQVIFNDQAAPRNVTTSPAPAGSVQAGPSAFTVSATQPGLGLGSFYVTDNGSTFATQNVACSNAWTSSPDSYSLASQNYQSTSPCPESATATFNLSSLPKGINTIVAHAVSILGYDTASAPVTINVQQLNVRRR